jgi:enamine deaminase RidA (YjgF/YER057c/UK114 family)
MVCLSLLLIGQEAAAEVAAREESISVRYIEPNDKIGSSAAVVVRAADLLHTEQFTAPDEVLFNHAGDVTAQAESVLRELESITVGRVRNPNGFSMPSTKLRGIVKLNVYVTESDAVAKVQSVLAKRFVGFRKPAVSYVVTRLPAPGAVVAMDAVAFSEELADIPAKSHAANLPLGRRAYVSGDAKPGDLSTATTETLKSLEATLKNLGTDRKHIVQLKAFFHPMSEAAKVREAVKNFFPDSPAPITILVEWTMAGPIEIELIASLPKNDSATGGSVSFVTPPGMTASPVFSRVAVTDDPTTIYISGLYGEAMNDGAAQVRGIFSQLDSILHKAGSDMRHLVKATYYVSDDDASTALNKIRPEFYDPQRPPAASKASVTSTGVADTGITLDMIAVPAPRGE